MSNRPLLRPVVLYVPAGGWSTARIPRGSPIVAQQRCGAHEIEVYFEGAALEGVGARPVRRNVPEDQPPTLALIGLVAGISTSIRN